MVTEVVNAKLRMTKKGTRQKVERLIEITGKDLIKFAAILDREAADAEAKGEHHRADRLTGTAAFCRTAKKFTYRLPT